MHSDLEEVPPRSENIFSSQSINETSVHFDGGLKRHRKLPNKWTDEQRIFLCVLQRWFRSEGCNNLNHQDQRKIFFVRFAEHFFAGPTEADMAGTALGTYFHQLKLDEHAIWYNICISTSFSDPHMKFAGIQDIIKKIIGVLDFEVVEREVDNLKLMQKSPKSRSKIAGRPPPVSNETQDAFRGAANSLVAVRYRSVPVQNPQLTFHPVPSTDEVQTTTTSMQPETTQEQDHTAIEDDTVNQTHFLPTTSAFDHKDRNGAQVKPYCNRDPYYVEKDALNGTIGFRTWTSENHGTNTTTGFTSGSFNGHYLPPPNRNSDTFAQTIFTHLRPLAEPSAWISIWLTLMPAIHRLLKSDKAALTFIDADYLAREDTTYPKIYSAKTAISQYRLRLISSPDVLRYTYTGGSEYIVWQDIEKHAVIFTLSRAQFEQHLRKNPDLEQIFALAELRQAKTVYKFRKMVLRPILHNVRVGYSIGKFLKLVELPRRFVAKTALMIAKGWCFVENESVVSVNNESYLRGIFAGYRGQDDSITKIWTTGPLFATQQRRSISVASGNAYNDDEYVDASDDSNDADSDGDDSDTVMGGTDEVADTPRHSSAAEDIEYVLVQSEGLPKPETPTDLLRATRTMHAHALPVSKHTGPEPFQVNGLCKATETSQPADPFQTAERSRVIESSHTAEEFSPSTPTTGLVSAPFAFSPCDTIDLPQPQSPPHPKTPSQKRKERFKSALFPKQIASHNQLAIKGKSPANGQNPAGALRKAIEPYIYGQDRRSSTVTSSPVTIYSLDEDSEHDSCSSPFFRSVGKQHNAMNRTIFGLGTQEDHGGVLNGGALNGNPFGIETRKRHSTDSEMAGLTNCGSAKGSGVERQGLQTHRLQRQNSPSEEAALRRQFTPQRRYIEKICDIEPYHKPEKGRKKLVF